MVGVHDSRSIYILKKRVPVDSTEKRMLNVKQYADVVSRFLHSYQTKIEFRKYDLYNGKRLVWKVHSYNIT